MNTIRRRLLVCILFALNLTRPLFAQDAFSFNFTTNQWTGHIGIILGADKKQPIGSGFAFGSHKDVVTCAHVFESAQVSFHETNLLFVSSDKVPRHLKLKYILPRYDLVVFTPIPEIKGDPFKVGRFQEDEAGRLNSLHWL